MLNTMVIIKMGNCTFDDWKKAFDADSETDAQFMKDIIVGKVDEHTAIVSADVFAPEKMEAMMSDPEFQKIEAEMGLEHTVNQVTPASVVEVSSQVCQIRALTLS